VNDCLPGRETGQRFADQLKFGKFGHGRTRMCERLLGGIHRDGGVNRLILHDRHRDGAAMQPRGVRGDVLGSHGNAWDENRAIAVGGTVLGRVDGHQRAGDGRVVARLQASRLDAARILHADRIGIRTAREQSSCRPNRDSGHGPRASAPDFHLKHVHLVTPTAFQASTPTAGFAHKSEAPRIPDQLPSAAASDILTISL